MEKVQAELPLMGDLKRPLHVHAPEEIALCKTKGDACRLALMHSGLTAETVAGRIGKSAGYLSLLLSGKKRWSDDLQFKFEQVTGSLAPHQWEGRRRGADAYFDPVRVRRAQLEAELKALESGESFSAAA